MTIGVTINPIGLKKVIASDTPFVTSGNISFNNNLITDDNGYFSTSISLLEFYNFCKKEWKCNEELINFPFPLKKRI